MSRIRWTFAETPGDGTFRYTRILGVENETATFGTSKASGRL